MRVAGSSMDGGRRPLRDGDWALLRVARSAPGPQLEGRVVLVGVPEAGSGYAYVLKRLDRQGRGWVLRSDHPAGPTIEGSDGMQVIARLEAVVRPEDLGPAPGARIEESALADGFGLESLVPRSGRQHGHLFVFIDRHGMLSAPDRLRYSPNPSYPSETAFILASVGETAWKYLGVARREQLEDTWIVPKCDSEVWARWGEKEEPRPRRR